MSIEKAGGIIVREGKSGEKEMYLIHRPRYDDWSVPKGHIDAGETPLQAALREVAEEAGMMCSVVHSLPPHFYTTPDGQDVIVHYFEMNMIEDGLDAHDDEVDTGEWLPVKEAIKKVSYESLRTYLSEMW